jgi:hypothetical protein
MRFDARLKVLERPLRQAQQMKLTRLLITSVEPFDWKNVTRPRRSFVPGTLLEIIDLHGTATGPNPEDLEAFVLLHDLPAQESCD